MTSVTVQRCANNAFFKDCMFTGQTATYRAFANFAADALKGQIYVMDKNRLLHMSVTFLAIRC